MCRLENNDGGNNVSGIHKVLQAKIKEIKPITLFVLFQAYYLNLVTHVKIQNFETAKDILYFIKELITYVKQSSKRLS